MLFSDGIYKFVGEDAVANQARSTWNGNVIVVMFSLVHVDMVEVEIVVEWENIRSAGE